MTVLGYINHKDVEYKVLKDASGRNFAMSMDGNYVTIEMGDDMVGALLGIEVTNNN